MKISSTSNVVNIVGNIKNISDLSSIREVLEDIKVVSNNITINIKDSISITSSVVGYLNKLVLKDNIKLDMNIGSKQLMNLLDDLNLTKTFNARYI